MSAIAVDDLQAQLAALRAENEQLRAQERVTADEVAPASAQPCGLVAGAPVRRCCIVIATILVPVSIVERLGARSSWWTRMRSSRPSRRSWTTRPCSR